MHRTGDPLSEVAEAIEIERRAQTEWHPTRVDSGAAVDRAERLWRLRLSVEAKCGRWPEGRGATRRANLVHIGQRPACRP